MIAAILRVLDYEAQWADALKKQGREEYLLWKFWYFVFIFLLTSLFTWFKILEILLLLPLLYQ